MNRLPNLVIIGVHKAGTTSLFSYLSEHPSIFGSLKKELHYFTPLRFGGQVPPVSEYAKHFEDWKSELYAVEASPSYLYGKESIINAMGGILPDNHKIILILRNPTSRFVSFYKHLSSKFLIKESETIESFLDSAKLFIGKAPISDNPFSRAINEGFYINYIEPWVEKYGNRIRIVYFEDMQNSPIDFMQDLSKWLGVDERFYENKSFEVENKTVYSKNKTIHRIALWSNQQLEPLLRKHPWAKKKIRSLYYTVNALKQQGKERKMFLNYNELDEIYKIPNMQLRLFLEKYGYPVPSWLL